MSDSSNFMPELVEQIKEQEVTRLASATSLVLLFIGLLLTSVGAFVLFGIGATLATAGVMTFIVGVLIGRE